MPRFNYVNNDKPEFMVDFTKSRNDSEAKVLYRFNNWDRGLRSRTKNYRNNAFNLGRKLDFIDMDYMGGNCAKGFNKHTQAIQYKYRMRRHIEKKDENEFNDEDLVLEEQATQGGDVMGYRQLDKSRAKELMDFINQYIDRDKIFDRALNKKIQMFYEALTWDMPVDKANTIERFF